MLFDFEFDLDFLKKNVPTLSNARDEDILKIFYRKLLSDGVPRQPILSGLRCAEKVIQRTVAQVRVSK